MTEKLTWKIRLKELFTGFAKGSVFMFLLFVGWTSYNAAADWIQTDTSNEITEKTYKSVSLVLLFSKDTQLHIIARDAMTDDVFTENELVKFSERMRVIDLKEAKDFLQEVFNLPMTPRIKPEDLPNNYKEGGKTFKF